MGNFEEWSSVMKEKTTHFDDVVDKLKSAVSNIDKMQKGARRVEDPGDEVTDEV